MNWRNGWVCQQCTFFNDKPLVAKCEICEVEPELFPSSPRSCQVGCSSSCNSSTEIPRPASASFDDAALPEVIEIDSDGPSSQITALVDDTPSAVERFYLVRSKSDIEVVYIGSSDDDAVGSYPQYAGPSDAKQPYFRPPVELPSVFVGPSSDRTVNTNRIGDASQAKKVVDTQEQKETLNTYQNFEADNTNFSLNRSEPVIDCTIKRRRKRTADKIDDVVDKKKQREKVALNKSRKLGKYFWSEILVSMPRSIWETYQSPIQNSIETIKGEIDAFVISDADSELIRWSRKTVKDDLDVLNFDKDSCRLLLRDSSLYELVPLPFSILLYKASAFLEEYDNGRLMNKIAMELARAKSRTAVVVQNLHGAVRLNCNRRMQQSLRQDSGPARTSSSSTGINNCKQIEDFAADILVRTQGRCGFLHFPNASEIGMFLVQATRHLGEEPYKPDPTTSLGIRSTTVSKSSVAGGIYSPSMKEWFNMLLRVPGISDKRAECIISKYPCAAALIQAYQQCDVDDTRRELVSELLVDGRRLGNALSLALFEHFWEE